ncbi:penicillin-binding protein 1C [Neptunicoccus cionae]|uniref:peptidoglycan glycosyltransferase n=1 Tax=Neptunicoccus cionae TaxID=2035344 RepID=A0A916QWD0_9RHOB|nr:penicillin-binding protein 1C [Amylibacter cionae]GGA16505.1 penicillin-binding protein 1C [Amylibacter cionae]
MRLFHLFLCLVVLAIVSLGAQRGLAIWVAQTDLPALQPEVSVVVEDREGRLLRAFTVADGRWRLPVELQEVSTNYITQLIAFEDKRFYNHNGVDGLAALRAIAQALANGGVVSGGSTLTMQVARLLEESGTGSWRGKLRQMRVAWALEQRLSKSEILRLYLHLAPFGGNLEGVRAAALSYFRKEPIRLTDAQAALLVALPQSPERRRPDRHYASAVVARDRVLERGYSAGILDLGAVKAARRERVPSQKYAFDFLAPHLAERLVAEAPYLTRHSLTLDREVQKQAETLLRARVRGRHKALSGAVMVMDHQSGEVIVSVGAPDYLDAARQGFVDMTRAVRSPGSTLKPLIYGLAFEQGLAHPETVIDDRPVRFGDYAPQNFDKQFRGQLRVRKALQMSLNVPAVSLLDAVGPGVLMARMRRAGAKPLLANTRPAGLAVGLGGVGLRLQDLVAIYGAIARGGAPVGLKWRTRDVPGSVARPPVLGPVAAWYVGDILRGVPAPPSAPQNEIAYKTGTSFGHRDVWAIGFDGRHTVGVWLGRADGAAMPGELGVGLAAPLLFDLFATLKPAVTPLSPPPAAALTGTTGALPQSLRRFRPRGQIGRDSGPRITFPPDGARIALGDEAVLVAKVDRGMPPFTWLANGVPIAVAHFERQVVLDAPGSGFLALSVIDATGVSQGVRVTLD